MAIRCMLDLPEGLSSAGLVALLAGCLVVYSLVSNYLSWRRLSHIPGPFWAAVSKAWMLRGTLSGNMHLALKKVCNDYGPLVRIGPNDVVTNDPEVLRKLWAVRSPYQRGSFYDAVRFDPTRDSLVSMRDDHAHSELRAKMAAGYAGKENEALESTIDGQILAFVDLLERKYLSSSTDFRPMDMARKAQYFTLDTITALAFGRPFGYLHDDKDVHEYIKTTEDSMPVMLVLTVFPLLARILQKPVLRSAMPSEHDKIGFGKFISVAKQVVGERLAATKQDRKDMLGSFLRHGLTREEAEGETLLQIIAGSDTTATAIRVTMLYLATSLKAYASLTEEIRKAAAAGTVSSPVTDAEARNLPYLQAVIKEGLRIHPPVVGLMSVTVPQGGDVIAGYPLPAGTEVGWAGWGVMHSRDIFGPDAEQFRPERWLEADEDQLRKMNTSWELIFRYGKWQCLGKTVAQIELNKIFVELLRRFDFSLINPTDPWKTYSAGIFLQSDLWMKVSRVE